METLNQSAEKLPELVMYQIPGQAPITKKDLEKYRESFNESQPRLEPIRENLRILLNSDQEKPAVQLSKILESLALVEFLPEEERNIVIKKALESGNFRVYDSALRFAHFLLEKDLEEVIEKRIELLELIPLLSAEKQISLLRKAVVKSSNSPSTLLNITRMISNLPESSDTEEILDKITRLIKEVIEKDIKNHLDTNLTNLQVLIAINNPKSLEIIEKALQEGSLVTKKRIILLLPSLPPESRANLVHEVIKTNNPSLLNPFLEDVLPHLSFEEIKNIEKELTSLIQNNDLKIEARAMILHCFPTKEKTLDLALELYNKSPYTQKGIIAELIPKLPEDQRIILFQYILEDKDTSWIVKVSTITAITDLPKADQENALQTIIDIIREKITDPVLNQQDKSLTLLLLPYLPKEKQDEFIDLYLSQGDSSNRLHQLASKSQLYKIGESNFFREKMTKTGSQTILLDQIPGQAKSLKEKVIIRRIRTSSYLQWVKAYESLEVWKELGFDYVPIEPILRSKSSKKHPLKTDVFTRVLPGPNVETWKRNTGLHGISINNAINRILKGLEILGIKHGHHHMENFCLVFFKDESGKPDLKRPPRVYVIDFDEAKS